jgi:serine protease Do
MNDQVSNTSKKRTFRSLVLGGTALALVFGGGVLGTSLDLVRTTPALADAVQVQGVEPLSFADVVDHVRPAVVSVRVKSLRADVSADSGDMPFQIEPGSPMEKFFKQFRQQMPNQQTQRPTTALGSGFIISDDGYVVTNNHVVDKEQSVTVILDDGTEYAAKVIGIDDKTDLALLKIDADKKFTYVKFSEDTPRVGDWVVAVGNPFGLGGTVTAGIISAHGRNIGAGPYDDFLQIDAAVNRGNSGGPAFNSKGEVVGINTAIFSPSGGNVGIAFAIPASTAERIVNDLKDHGEVVRGWLGVQIQSISQDIADSLRLKDDKGALVAEVQDGSPAQKAGFKLRDVITGVDGKPVADSRDLAKQISSFAPGKTVKVTYWRDGKSQDMDVTLGKLPGTDQMASAEDSTGPAVDKSASLQDFGLTVAPADNDSGVMITEVDPNGQAAERGLQAGDVILSVGDSTVKSPSDVDKIVSTAKADGLKAVLLRVKSGERTQFIALSFART